MAALRKTAHPQAKAFNSPWPADASHAADRTMPRQFLSIDFFWAWRARSARICSPRSIFPLPGRLLPHHFDRPALCPGRACRHRDGPAGAADRTRHLYQRAATELLMADWSSTRSTRATVPRRSPPHLRDMWIQVFEGYARTCYEACTSVVVALRGQPARPAQLGSGRRPAQSSPMDRPTWFAGLEAAEDDARPTMALIGRGWCRSKT